MQFKKLHQRQKSKYYNYIYFFAHSVLLLNYPSLFGGPFFKNLYLNLKRKQENKKRNNMIYISIFFLCFFKFFLVGLIHSPSSWSSHSHMLLISIISFFLCGFWKKIFFKWSEAEIKHSFLYQIVVERSIDFLAYTVKKA